MTDQPETTPEIERLRALLDDRTRERGPDVMRPGGPLCGCDACEIVRQQYGVEELTPELLARCERLAAVPIGLLDPPIPAPPGAGLCLAVIGRTELGLVTCGDARGPGPADVCRQPSHRTEEPR